MERIVAIFQPTMPHVCCGPGGSQVKLTFESPTGETKTTWFTRQRVQIRSITRKVILDETRGIGYIRMEGFQSNTAEELDEALRELERKGMRALIWDLRGNPGGLLETAAAVIERFIDRGVLGPRKAELLNSHRYFRRMAIICTTIH